METKPLILSSGMVPVPVERDGVHVGEIRIFPDDPAFLNRFYGLLTSLENRRRTLAALPEDEAHLAETLTALERGCAETLHEIDLVFGEGTGALVFGEGCSPAMLGQFLDGISAVLAPRRTEKLQAYLAPESALCDDESAV